MNTPVDPSREQARFNMIEQQIRPWDVLDQQILQLLGEVRREDFVPPAHRAVAFMDTEIPLGEGQVMLSPKVEARMVQELNVQPHERVLEIGAGSGFVAALLSHRAREVVSLEIRPALVQMAERNLKRAGRQQVQVRLANAAEPIDDGPFDAILVSGAVAAVPQAWIELLRDGGRLLAIEGGLPVMRAVRIVRGADEAVRKVDLFDTVAPLLDGMGPPTTFRF